MKNIVFKDAVISAINIIFFLQVITAGIIGPIIRISYINSLKYNFFLLILYPILSFRDLLIDYIIVIIKLAHEAIARLYYQSKYINLSIWVEVNVWNYTSSYFLISI